MYNKILKKVNRKIRNLLPALADGATSTGVLSRYIERRHRKSFRVEPARSAEFGKSHSSTVEALNAYGVATAMLEELQIPGSAKILRLARDLVANHEAHFQSAAARGVQFLMLPASQIALNPELFIFGLQNAFLEIAEAYLGQPVAYDGVSIQYTVADGTETSTRAWHRDREDRKMVKVIIYLNDVDTLGGPFQILSDGAQYNGARGRKYRFQLTAREKDDLSNGYPAGLVECAGKAGTVIFADTAGYFHRGKPVYSENRAAIFFSYFTQCPQRPFFCDRSGLRRNEIAKMCVGLSVRQKRAALWRESLPLHWRWLPPAPVL